jgi:uncharacterized membrane protein
MPNAIHELPVEQIQGAFVNHYNPPKAGANPCKSDELLDVLRKLPALSKEDHVDTIHVQLQKHHSLTLQPQDHALIAFIDDAFSEMLKQTDLDFKVESYVRDLAPHVAAIAIEENVIAITRQQPILSLLDTIIVECVGWSEDLGILGEQFMTKIAAPITEITNGRATIESTQKDLEKLFTKESPILRKREKQLRDSELVVLAGHKAIYNSAELLNKLMTGKQLPMFIIFLLQGAWFEFLQQTFITFGIKSKEWLNISRLTEALIWSLQPNINADKRQEVINSLPGQLIKFCKKTSFNTEQMENSLADIEIEYRAIAAGEPGDSCDFELLDLDPSMADGNTAIDKKMLRQISGFDHHRWFLYDDKSESEEKVARLKLILNWQDSERLLFTNHNRRKVLHMTYSDMANNLEKGTVRELNLETLFFESIGSHLMQILQSVSRQNKTEKKAKKAKERKALSSSYLASREQALASDLANHRKLAKLKEKRAKILRHKANQKLDAASAAVQALNVDAWVKLPIMEGTLTACKLVAIIAGSDKHIFSNRAGLKVAEYTGRRLAHLIVTENSEILDTGAEFENVLASVVTGLRADKDKSYDELTGDMA